MKKIELNFKRLLDINFNNSKDPLTAINEAIVNSIQSIEELGIKNNGSIDVFIQRVNDPLKFNKLEKNKNIENIIITDNGSGFTEANFLSFSTYASELKINKGCKGIGRLTWLKFFNFVEIESQYKENNKFYKRNFLFTENEIENDEIIELNEFNYSENKTVIKLQHLKKTFSLDLDNIANKILNHLFVYFLNNNMPTISIIDNEEVINLNDLFSKQKQENMKQEEIQIGEEKFNILHSKNYSSSDVHFLFYCADNRTVSSININNDIKVHTKLTDDKGKFVYNGYITSNFLDKNVNQDRTDFYIENDSKEPLLPNFLTKENIKINIIPNVLNFLKENIEIYRAKKKEIVKNYIHKENPKYRYLLKNVPEFIDEINIKEKFKNEELELEIFKQEQKYSLQLKEKEHELKKQFQENQHDQTISQKVIEYVKEVSESGKKDLIDYVVKRKIILEMLEKNMEYVSPDNSTYALEKTIHELIFPMHTTSDDIDYESHNLWIIDERLAYHYYLASDKSLKSLPNYSCDNRSEPDIIIFNNAFAISNEKEKFNDIIIIEFKRPSRNDYTYENNPIEQIINYVKAIKNGEIKQKNGREIYGYKDLRFFCYIIADITPTFDKILEREDFIALLNNGFYKYHQKYQSYIEVIPYDKLLQNARQRNRILFDKLFNVISKK